MKPRTKKMKSSHIRSKLRATILKLDTLKRLQAETAAELDGIPHTLAHISVSNKTPVEFAKLFLTKSGRQAAKPKRRTKATK